MSVTTMLLGPTTGQLNVTGSAIPADGWFGVSTGLHTIAIYAFDMIGRVYIEGSIANCPQEDDWFELNIFPNNMPFIQYPVNPNEPTGALGTGSDTSTLYFNITANLLWIRARVDRSYLPGPFQTPLEIATVGVISKILMGR